MTTAVEGGEGQRHALAALYPLKRHGTHCTDGWVATGPVWTGPENFASIGIRFPHRPARSQDFIKGIL